MHLVCRACFPLYVPRGIHAVAFSARALTSGAKIETRNPVCENAFAVIPPTFDGQADLFKIWLEKFTAKLG
jgi:hypothetical protein